MADVGSHIGTAPLGEEINGVNFSESWLSLSSGADYPKVLEQVRAVASSHPGAFSDVQTYLHERIDEVLTNGTTDDIVVRVYGTGLGELGALGNQLAAVLARVPGLTDVHPAALNFVPQVAVQVNLAAARRYGLTPGVIRRAAAIMMASEPMSEISSGGVLTLVTAWSTPGTRQNLASLRQLQIDTPNGGRVALGQVASITVEPSPSQILRENSQRYTEVDANVSGRSLSSVTGAVSSALAKFRFPAGYRYTLLGEATERAAAQRRLLIEGLAAALVILLLLQAAFGSWRLSFLLFLTLPAALVGGVLAAWGGLGTITLGALVGFFTVLGIAARNGILLISHFRHLEKAEGVPFGPELVIRGASERLSPIMMTALATALALLPLVLYGNRPGQEIEYPMAIVILGGLATSTLLNLFVLPVLYLSTGQRRRDRQSGRTPAGGMAPAALPGKFVPFAGLAWRMNSTSPGGSTWTVGSPKAGPSRPVSTWMSAAAAAGRAAAPRGRPRWGPGWPSVTRRSRAWSGRTSARWDPPSWSRGGAPPGSAPRPRRAGRPAARGRRRRNRCDRSPGRPGRPAGTPVGPASRPAGRDRRIPNGSGLHLPPGQGAPERGLALEGAGRDVQARWSARLAPPPSMHRSLQGALPVQREHAEREPARADRDDQARFPVPDARAQLRRPAGGLLHRSGRGIDVQVQVMAAAAVGGALHPQVRIPGRRQQRRELRRRPAERRQPGTVTSRQNATPAPNEPAGMSRKTVSQRTPVTACAPSAATRPPGRRSRRAGRPPSRPAASRPG